MRNSVSSMIHPADLPSRDGVRADRQRVQEAALAGTGAEITQVFTHRAPGHRLLVLGGPGSGKSMLLLTLLKPAPSNRARSTLRTPAGTSAAMDGRHR
jgi:predicted ATPase with chaperone activity